MSMNLDQMVAMHEARIAELEEKLVEMIALMKIMSDVSDGIKEKVESRNKSAALKRNMTEADALRVLTGDLKDKNHNLAAEVAGLTYAQVYSARLGFTFKTVHQALRTEKWVNPWIRTGVHKIKK